MLKTIRTKIKQYPFLHKSLLPSWIALHHYKWIFRNIVTGRAPVSYCAGNIPLKLYCDGQIPEALYLGFELEEREFVSSFLKSGMCVMDIGANVGLYSVMASALVGDKGSVHAFEPSGSTYGLLKRNLELNGCNNVSTNNLALSDSCESLVLRVDPQHPNFDAHRYVEKRGNVETLLDTDEVVQCETLDLYCANLGKIDFIKMDVEGAELSVLQGAKALLSREDAPLIMFECDKSGKDVANLLMDHGYQLYTWDHGERILKPSTLSEALSGGNLIAAKEASLRCL